jgi:hypothetical protein
VLLERGEPAAAEGILRWALGLPPERYEKIANFVPICEFLLGACRADQGATAEARALLEKHAAGLVAIYGVEHPVVKVGRRRMDVLESDAGGPVRQGR